VTLRRTVAATARPASASKRLMRFRLGGDEAPGDQHLAQGPGIEILLGCERGDRVVEPAVENLPENLHARGNREAVENEIPQDADELSVPVRTAASAHRGVKPAEDLLGTGIAAARMEVLVEDLERGAHAGHPLRETVVSGPAGLFALLVGHGCEVLAWTEDQYGPDQFRRPHDLIERLGVEPVRACLPLEAPQDVGLQRRHLARGQPGKLYVEVRSRGGRTDTELVQFIVMRLLRQADQRKPVLGTGAHDVEGPEPAMPARRGRIGRPGVIRFQAGRAPGGPGAHEELRRQDVAAEIVGAFRDPHRGGRTDHGEVGPRNFAEACDRLGLTGDERHGRDPEIAQKRRGPPSGMEGGQAGCERQRGFAGIEVESGHQDRHLRNSWIRGEARDRRGSDRHAHMLLRRGGGLENRGKSSSSTGATWRGHGPPVRLTLSIISPFSSDRKHGGKKSPCPRLGATPPTGSRSNHASSVRSSLGRPGLGLPRRIVMPASPPRREGDPFRSDRKIDLLAGCPPDP